LKTLYVLSSPGFSEGDHSLRYASGAINDGALAHSPWDPGFYELNFFAVMRDSERVTYVVVRDVNKCCLIDSILVQRAEIDETLGGTGVKYTVDFNPWCGVIYVV
jgi:hypothetical protein